jgi:excisionase family DNA binding protein
MNTIFIKGDEKMHEKLLTANEVARILNISRSKAYSLMRERAIPTITIGKSVRVTCEDLENYLSSNRTSKGEENEYIG